MSILIFGAGGGLGQALTEQAVKNDNGLVIGVSRQALTDEPGLRYLQVKDYSAESLADLAEKIQDELTSAGESLTGVISTIGVLHSADFMPEKRLAEVNAAQLSENFQVNAILPILLLQQFLGLLPTKAPAYWVQLSAMVGSATDNKLGGWYSYRASKAALNMLLKTASIELQRTHKKLTIAAIHPGTTDTDLSKPFQQRIADGKLYTPQQSAERIFSVIDQLTPAESGKLFNWTGEVLPF